MKLLTHSLPRLLKYSAAIFSTILLLNPPAWGADRILIKLGFLEKTVAIEELNRFAATGELSPSLGPYSPLLNSQVRDLLQKHLHIEPLIAQQFLDDLLYSADGEELIQNLNEAFPDSTPEQLKLTIKKSLERSHNLNILEIFKAYPEKQITLNLLNLVNIATRLNKNTIENKIIESQLIADSEINTVRKLSNNLNPEKIGKNFVYQDTIIFQDRERNRKLVTDIYSAIDSKKPLIVMSHGFAADRRFLKYLAHHLASHGFTVVSIEHPGSNINSLVNLSSNVKINDVLRKSEFIDRPKDVSFILDQLEKINYLPGYFQGKLKTERVTIIGHSFGGYTALALAGARLNPQSVRRFCQRLKLLERSPADWLQCSAAELPYKELWLRDSRIARAIVLNPIVGHLFNDDLSDVKIPTLFLASSQDGITPILDHQIEPFYQLKGEKYLLVAGGATHMSITDISYLNSTMGQSTLVREVMDEKAEPLRKAIRGLSLAFVEQLTSEADLYKPYLTENYLSSLSSEDIKLRLKNHTPSSVNMLIGMLQLGSPKQELQEPPTQTTWGEKLDNYLFNLGRLFLPPEYHTGQLESVFGELLRHYDRETREWS